MSKKKRLIPFSIRNIFAGLQGKSKAVAEAEYYYTDEDLERKLLEIETDDQYATAQDYQDLDDNLTFEAKKDIIYQEGMLGIDLKYKNISQEDYDYKIVSIQNTGVELSLAHLDLDLKYSKITDLEYQKKKAEILKEPWVHAEVRIAEGGVLSGHFDVDWNQYWIDELIAKGFVGSSDEEIIQKWLSALNRNALIEDGEYLDLDEDRHTPRTPLDKGRAEYK